MAKRTASGLNEIRKLINIEEKIVETTTTGTNFDTTGIVQVISQMAQGTDYINNRVGDSIKLQHIEVRGRFFKATAATSSVLRCLLVRDLDGYGTAPTTNDILQTVGTALGPLSPHDFLNRKRFAVLYDELLTLNSTGDSSAVFEVSMPHSGHVLYLGTTAAAASNGKGSLYLVFVSDEATNTPTVSYQSRVVFTDD